MWWVEPDFSTGEHSMSVVHLGAIFHAAHLIGIAGEDHIPHDLKHTDSLNTFHAYFVKKFIDYHAHETIY